MTRLQQMTVVAQRELVEHVRQPAFFTSTSITVLLVLPMVVATGLLQSLVDGDGATGATLPVAFSVLVALGQVTAGAFIVANGVVEETYSRVAEVITARVGPRTLLAGKLVGLGAASLLQLLLLVVVVLITVALSPDLSMPAGLAGDGVTILLWYVLAFAVFASLFSIAGAISARPQEVAQTLQPAMILVSVVFAATVYALDAPQSALTRVLSLVPVTAPGVMPARAAGTSLAAWEMPLAIALSLATVAGALWVAGSVYAPARQTNPPQPSSRKERRCHT